MWLALSTVHFIILLGSIDSSSELNCNDGIAEALNRCLALVESGLAQRPAKVQTNEGCIMPNMSNSHAVLESNRTVTLAPGEVVPHMSSIIYECALRYLHVGPELNLCSNGQWYSEAHPICIMHCPNSNIIGISIKAACERNGLVVSCDEPIVPGTVAWVKCRNSYTQMNTSLGAQIGSHAILCQEDGKWNNNRIPCVPVCGKLVTRRTPFIQNGEFTNITFVPWHIAIYKKESDNYVYHCGGTIVTEHVIFTAPLCFLKPGTEDFEDKSLFLVGAGKHLGDYIANDPKAQFRTIKSITMHAKMRTFVVLWLRDPLVFTPLIAPVCMKTMSIDTTISQKSNLVNYGREEKNGLITRDIRLISISHESKFINCASIKVNETCAPDQCVTTFCRNFLGSMFTIEVIEFGISRHHLVGIANVTENVISILQANEK